MIFSKKFLLNLLPILGIIVILSLVLSSYEIVIAYFGKSTDQINKLLTASGYRIFLTTIATHAFWFAMLGLTYNYIKKD